MPKCLNVMVLVHSKHIIAFDMASVDLFHQIVDWLRIPPKTSKTIFEKRSLPQPFREEG